MKSVSASPQKNFDDVRAAFETGAVLHSSPNELEQLLLALGRETTGDSARQARTAEMGRTMRQLLATKRSAELHRRPSALARFALLMALTALLCSGAQAYYAWKNRPAAVPAETSLAQDFNLSPSVDDPRVSASLAELARHAPTLRRGTVQAWWNGEQARQVLRLEREAKRQLLAGDRAGAAASASRADAIRNEIDSLAAFEKPAPK
ncbi:MAG: hypothetical protein ACR2HH_07885 [Chthoniobacterales bacterium]